MDSGSTLKPIFWVLLLLMSLGHSNPYSGTSSDSSSLVYTKCANQSFTGATEAYHRTLSALYQQLLTESYRSKFFKSTAGDENLGISGLFQCRGDLGNDDCQHCVGGLPETLGSRCGQAVAARVQLSGCYLRYETDGFPEHELWPSEGGGGRSDDYESELLHEKCSSKSDNSSDFKTAREAAFAAVEAQLAKAEVGFCEKEIEHVQVVAQCEGGLGACDCGQCVHAAAEIAEEKCGSSVTGEVYLSKCYLSYSYDSEDSSGNSKNATAKTIALVLGGAAAFCGFIALLKFLKSDTHKDDTSDC